MVIVVELGTGPLQVTVVVEQLQSPQNLLRAAPDKGRDLTGTKKTMPMNLPDDVVIAFGQLQPANRGNAFETWQTGGLHPNTIPMGCNGMKASEFARWGCPCMSRLELSLWSPHPTRAVLEPAGGWCLLEKVRTHFEEASQDSGGEAGADEPAQDCSGSESRARSTGSLRRRETALWPELTTIKELS